MLAEKKALSLEDIEAQSAFELPERATPALIVITCLVCVGRVHIPIRIEDVNVAVQVCAAVDAIQVIVGGSSVDAFNCEVTQQ